MSLYSLVKINHTAPNFSLFGTCQQKTKIYSLVDFRKSWLILYFYSGNFNPISKIDLLNFQSSNFQSSSKFQEQNIQLLAISTDSLVSQATWSQELNLTFPLLSDIGEHQTCKDYNVYSEKNGNANPAIFVINPENILEFYQVNNHQIGFNLSDILAKIESLKKLKN